MSNIKEQILTLVKQRHHSHKVALEQEKDPRSKHAVDLIARIREDSQLIELIDSLPEDDPLNDPRFCEGFDVGRAVQRIFDGTEESCKDSLQVPETRKENTDSFTNDLEEAADKFEQEYFTDATIGEAFIAGAKWMEDQMPMPEDTVIFQKGVAEGRRLERDDGGLAWQDIKSIVQIADKMLDDPKARVAFQNHNEEYYYKRVLEKYEADSEG